MERTLTARELNRTLLERQSLLARTKSPIPKALERIGGIQAQYAPAMYIGLHARTAGFERDRLTAALERRSVVQGTMMRVTIHLASKRDYWHWVIGIRQPRRQAWAKAAHRMGSTSGMPQLAKRLRKRLAADETITGKELKELAGSNIRANGAGLWLDLVRVPPSGTWEHRRADLYAAAEDWLGPEPEVDPAVALADLISSYLRGFGPSTRDEIANYCGLRKADIEAALDTLRLRSFRAEDGAELLDLPRQPLPDPETPAPVRLLPVWDSTLLAHARRALILREEDRSKVFSTKTPHSVNTFIVDGVVEGTWRFEKDRVLVEPFGKLDRAVKRELDAEAERIAELQR